MTTNDVIGAAQLLKQAIQAYEKAIGELECLQKSERDKACEVRILKSAVDNAKGHLAEVAVKMELK